MVKKPFKYSTCSGSQLLNSAKNLYCLVYLTFLTYFSVFVMPCVNLNVKLMKYPCLQNVYYPCTISCFEFVFSFSI